MARTVSAADPPNATLSVFEQGQDDLLDVVVKLQNPRYQGDDLIYDITLIDKERPLPNKGGPASLFIDIFGVWRRAARRTVWIGAAAATTAEASAAAAAAAHPTAVTVKETMTAPPAAPAMSSSQESAVARLKELKSLQQQGLITEAQYQAESQKLLNQIAE
ncbi:MAG: SHOCT domain-containing protein [Desulfobacterales bacterium]